MNASKPIRKQQKNDGTGAKKGKCEEVYKSSSPIEPLQSHAHVYLSLCIQSLILRARQLRQSQILAWAPA